MQQRHNAHGGLSTAEFLRLSTWMVEIAQALLPPGTRRADRGSDWHFSGGLEVRKRDGAWYDFSASTGGYSALSLIALLKKYSHAEATQWAISWLAGHAGTGSCTGAGEDASEDGDDAAGARSRAAAAASAARAEEVLAAAVPVEGTVGATYLASRGLEAPYPACVKWLPDARIGEGALVGVLTARGATVGVQLAYLDPTGCKSLHEPVRQTFLHDREHGNGLMFQIQDGKAGNAAGRERGVVLLAEGLEDGLSLRAAGCTETIRAVPGVNYIRHINAAHGQKITIVRDGDAPDSPADKGLIRGIDHLLLAGADVKVTATPEDEDANSILRKENGAVELNNLVDAASPAELSLAGEVVRLARMSSIEYDQHRRDIAREFRIRCDTLDKAVEAQRKRWANVETQPTAGDDGLVLREPEPWTKPVKLAEVLAELRERLEKHIVFTARVQSLLVTLWIAHTYVYHIFEHTPRMVVDSPQPGCGKTTLVGILELTTHRPVPCDGLSPPGLIRLKAAAGSATVSLDEMNDHLAASAELDQVLRSGFQRGRRYIKLRPDPDGDYVHELHDVFLPVAISLVGAIKSALASRSIFIHLQRKPKGVRVAKLRHGRNRAILLEIGQKLARWAEDDGEALVEPPAEQIPEALSDRQGDFSAVLLAIADQAGGTWPQEARRALVPILSDSNEQAEDSKLQLLSDVRDVFNADLQANPQVMPNKQEMLSAELVTRLHGIEDAPWQNPEKGRPLSQASLAAMLRPFRAWPEMIGPSTQRRKGYRRLHLARAWDAYLPKESPFGGSHTYTSGGNPPETEDFQGSHPAEGVSPEKTEKTADARHECDNVTPDSPTPRGDIHSQGETGPSAAKSHNHSGKDFSTDGGQKPPREARLSRIERLILVKAAAHPEWDEKRLGKECGQPATAVKAALRKRAQQPPDTGEGGEVV
jgi:putative DNA primase/helicase